MTTPQDRRLMLAQTFNRAAGCYHRARPDYPVELFDDLVTVTELAPGDRLLEIGCATGKATLPLARRGFLVTCIEPGPELASVARRNLDGLGADVIEGRFEDWQPAPGEQFGLIFAATAWNWIDPACRYALAWRALRPGAHLAFWDALHVFPDGGDPFFREIQDVYDQIGEGLPPGNARPGPGEMADHAAEIEASGLFEVVHIRHFDWERVYDADGYIELLSTFSNHIAMEDRKRERLCQEIRLRVGQRPGNAVRRHWGAVLHIARRRD